MLARARKLDEAAAAAAVAKADFGLDAFLRALELPGEPLGENGFMSLPEGSTQAAGSEQPYAHRQHDFQLPEDIPEPPSRPAGRSRAPSNAQADSQSDDEAEEGDEDDDDEEEEVYGGIMEGRCSRRRLAVAAPVSYRSIWRTTPEPLPDLTPAPADAADRV